VKKYPSSSQTVSINHARILMKNSQFIHSDARPAIHDRNTATVTVWIVFLGSKAQPHSRSEEGSTVVLMEKDRHHFQSGCYALKPTNRTFCF